jgi:hypothetical protein
MKKLLLNENLFQGPVMKPLYSPHVSKFVKEFLPSYEKSRIKQKNERLPSSLFQ